MMKLPSTLSRTALHAIRAALFLARAEPGVWVSAADVAGALGAPANYMGKTLNALTRQGVVEARRGRNGGYRLGRAPETLTLAALVETVDDLEPSYGCLLSAEECSERGSCTAHARWQQVIREAWRPLQSTTVADLIRDPTEDDRASLPSV